MKVLAINGSPHENGSTYNAMCIAAQELLDQGIEVEFIQIGSKPIQGCTACGGCRSTERTCIHDDIVNQCLKKAKEVDGLILGSPVYYAGISGNMKCFLDRFFFTGPDLRFKVGAAICAVRRSGGVPVFQQLNSYFNLASMIITPTHYWSAIHGQNGDQIKEDGEGVQMMRAVGQNMAWLIKAVDIAKQSIPVPEREKRIFTNFIR